MHFEVQYFKLLYCMFILTVTAIYCILRNYMFTLLLNYFKLLERYSDVGYNDVGYNVYFIILQKRL